MRLGNGISFLRHTAFVSTLLFEEPIFKDQLAYCAVHFILQKIALNWVVLFLYFKCRGLFDFLFYLSSISCSFRTAFFRR